MARFSAVVWTLLILAACSIPGHSITSTSFWEADKLFHFLSFLVFTVLWYGAARGASRHRFWVAGGLGLAYSLLTEAYQGVMPIGRTMDILDVAANLLGVSTGLLLVWLTIQSRRRRSSQS